MSLWHLPLSYNIVLDVPHKLDISALTLDFGGMTYYFKVVPEITNTCNYGTCIHHLGVNYITNMYKYLGVILCPLKVPLLILSPTTYKK